MDKSLINQISDLLSQINEDTVYFYYDSTAFASCQLEHWQAKDVCKVINCPQRIATRRFWNHLDKLRVADWT